MKSVQKIICYSIGSVILMSIIGIATVILFKKFGVKKEIVEFED